MPKVAITSLGCPRNLVDSEVLVGIFKDHGYAVTEAEKGADILVINTCSFIQSAREESVEAILDAANLKKEGKARRVIVCGCLPQMYRSDTLKALPEVDAVFGAGDFAEIGKFLKRIERGEKASVISRRSTFLYDDHSPRVLLTPKHYAYVKVAEGCDNFCSYCVISHLRGRLRSRTIESVLKEVKNMSRSGNIKEICLAGQDTTVFGKDNYGKPKLAELLGRMAALDTGIQWIRVLYTHPAHYTDELIDAVAREAKICKYLDIPIQHISDKILKKMNRRTSKQDIIELIDRLRERIPGIVLRTSVIAGFPGETEADFKELLEFVKEGRFERLGAFTYSKEDGTPASKMPKQVPADVKVERVDRIMKAQQEISLAFNRTFIGRTLKVLIDEPVEGEDGEYIGRTEFDAPEIDGIVYVSGKGLKKGSFYDVKITDALEYDLVGEAK